MTSLSIWQQLKESLVPTASYWVLNLFSFVFFCATVLFFEGFDLEGIFVLVYVGGIVFGGMLAGQLLALLRIRTWIILILGFFSWMFGFSMAVAAGSLGAFIALALIFAPIAAWGGMWSLDTNRALWSTWLPLIWTTGTILLWAEEQGKDAAWFAGNKHAIWDVVSLGMLGGTLVLVLLYLVTRETYRLALWKRGQEAPLPPSISENSSSRPRLSILGFGLILVMSGLLTLGTALVAPYFWRVGHGDTDNGNSGQTEQQQQQQQQSQGEGEGEGQGQELMEKMQKAAEQASKAACVSITLLVLAGLMLLVGWRPVKRLFVLRHLRMPFWRTSTSERIEHGWRLVEIALGDIGIHPLPGEDALGLARRALPILKTYSPVEVHGLEAAASAADRVRFGLGVTAEDLAIMERFSVWASDTIWERISQKEQFKAMYRGI